MRIAFGLGLATFSGSGLSTFPVCRPAGRLARLTVNVESPVGPGHAKKIDQVAVHSL